MSDLQACTDPDTFTAILQNYATYARAIDEKRFDLLAQVFAADATLHYRVAGHEFSCRGAEASTHFSAFVERCYWTHHLIAHPMVEMTADGAFASARVTATHLQRRFEGSLNRWLVRGSYHDRFARREGRWLIVRRDCWCLDAEGHFESAGIEQFPSLAWTTSDALV